MKKNYRFPPEDLRFDELFQFLWNHGVGNILDQDGDPTPWTDASLASAFDSEGRDISLRTIQHWKSGKYFPSRKNIYILAKIIGNGDENSKQVWADALIKGLSKTKGSRSLSRNHNHLPETLAPDIQSPDIKFANLKKTRSKLPILLALVVLLFFATLLIVFKSKPASLAIATIDYEGETPELGPYFQSLTIDINNSLVKSSDIRILSRREVKIAEEALLLEPQKTDLLEIFRKKHGIQYLLIGESRSEGAFEFLDLSLSETKSGRMKWAKTFNLQTQSRFDIYEETVLSIGGALGVESELDIQKKNLFFGTDNENAYTEYLTGRQLLKYWHETKDGSDIWRANAAFDNAIKLDSEMGLAYFHKADAYYHQAAGDIRITSIDTRPDTYMPISAKESVKAIREMMSLAAKHSHSMELIAQAKVNEIYFSDDWRELRIWGEEFFKQASSEKGELEWFFEPVILLLLNEIELSEELILDRITKYDPLNGTGHAYLTRLRLISNDIPSARKALEDAKTATFSSRLAEVTGYILFFEGNANGLYNHVSNSETLSPIHQDYFLAMSAFLSGNKKEALIRLESSEALQVEKVHLAFGLHHIGEPDKAISAFNEIANTAMGPVHLTVAMVYGAACGPRPLPEIEVLHEKMSRANIEYLPCIGVKN